MTTTNDLLIQRLEIYISVLNRMLKTYKQLIIDDTEEESWLLLQYNYNCDHISEDSIGMQRMDSKCTKKSKKMP